MTDFIKMIKVGVCLTGLVVIFMQAHKAQHPVSTCHISVKTHINGAINEASKQGNIPID